MKSSFAAWASPPSTTPKEIPEDDHDQYRGRGKDSDFHGIELHVAGAVNARNRRLLVSTDTDESDMAALAITGDSSHPVTG